MYPKCSLNGYNTYLQIFGLFALVIILIIASIYYMRVYHENILEKYTNTNLNDESKPIELGLSINYKDNTAIQSGDRSTYPLNKYPGADKADNNKTTDKYKFRECKVYFTDNIAKCDAQGAPKTCSYTFDGWQEFDTYTDKSGKIIQYPKKIFNEKVSNTDELVNSYFTSKCFKEFDNNGLGNAQQFEYLENDLIKYDSKGLQSNTEKDTNRFGGKKYTSIQFLSSGSASDNFKNLMDSICSVKHISKHSDLLNKQFYKFIINGNNTISNVIKVKLNSEQTNFTSINDNAILDFATLSQTGIRINKISNTYSLQAFRKSDNITKPVKVYKFTYATNLCADSKIKSYTTRETVITVSNFVKFSKCTDSEITNSESAETGIDLSALQDTEKDSFTKTNGDFTQAILNLIDQKRLSRTQVLKDVSQTIRNNIEANIRTIEQGKITAIANKDKYIPKDKTFLGIVNLKKEGSSKGIFDYKPGYVNTPINVMNIPNGAFIDITTFVFPHTGNSSQKEYTFIVPEGNTYICEILVVGGGGGGGSRHGGGGGGGAVIYIDQVRLISGNYRILVGSGGRGAQDMGEGSKGADSSIIYNNDPNNPIILAKGGGGGNHYSSTGNANKDGGSGGGGGDSGGAAILSNIPSGKYGNSGGKCSTGTREEWAGGGGGGAGGEGNNSVKQNSSSISNEGVTVFTDRYYKGTSYVRGEGRWNMNETPGMGITNDSLSSMIIPKGYKVTLYYHGGFSGATLEYTSDTPELPDWFDNQTSGFIVTKINYSAAVAGDGGDGINVSIAGKNLLLGAGGGGGSFINSISKGKGGKGGGGDGSMGSERAKDGKAMSGSGGGGGGFDSNDINGIGGNGGSGVIIINIKNEISARKEEEIIKNLDNLYKKLPPIEQRISIPEKELQFNIITSFIYLQKGYYRFRADIGDVSSNTYGNPNIRHAILGIYDESTLRSNGTYDFLTVFSYINYNNSNKPAYLKSYLNIETNKFYKLIYFYAATNINNLPFKLWYKYSSTQPNLELTYVGYSNDIISEPRINSIPIGQRDKYMVFTTGNYTITVPNDGVHCDILIVGGGGGGGNYGGGGGGGGVTQKTITLTSGKYLVTVGAGGNGGIGRYNPGENGGTSSITSTEVSGFLGLFGAGGGGGGTYNKPPNITPTAGSTKNRNFSSGGGGGGGASEGVSRGETGNGVSGNGGTNPGLTKSGGGGGATGNGADATSNGAGNGGTGIISTITGSRLSYGGGGGGGTWTGGIPGTGTDGGGNGAVEHSGILPTSGTATNIGGTGGGGGGGGGLTPVRGVVNQDGANGGSGIVIIRYRTITEVNKIPTSLKIKDSDKINGSYMFEPEKIIDISDEMNSYLFSGEKETSSNIDENNSVYQHYRSTTMKDIFSTINYNNDNIEEWKNFQGLAYYLNRPSINFFNITQYDDDINKEKEKLLNELSTLDGQINSDDIIKGLKTLSTSIQNIDYNKLIGVPNACLNIDDNNLNRFIDKSGFQNTDKTYEKLLINELKTTDVLTPNLVSTIYIEAI